MRFSVDLGPESTRQTSTSAIISPDGTRIVFPARSDSGFRKLATRQLDQGAAVTLAGTEGSRNPFFSPDGQWIGFFADGKWKKMSVLGGAAVTLCPATASSDGRAGGAVWGEDGTIIVTLDAVHLFRVPAAGGQPVLVGKPEEHGDQTWRWPQFLPGGESLL